MLGIALTIFAVFVVICFALCYSDRPSGSGPGTDAIFYVKPKNVMKNPDRGNSGQTGPFVNR
jgi:hypothetical protein